MDRHNSLWLRELCNPLQATREALQLLRVPRNLRAAYIGWLGHGNLGDEAIFQAIVPELDPVRLRLFSGMTKERILRCVFGSNALFRCGILGGGTLILGGYAGHLEPILDRGLPCYVFGTGVLDPDELKANGEIVDVERWLRVLRKLGKIHVRGPRSSRILRNLGLFNVDVCGDPALLHGLEVLPSKSERQILGINVFYPKQHYSSSNTVIKKALFESAQWALRKGWKLKLFSASAEDLKATIQFAAELNLGAESIFPVYDDARRFLKEVGDCRLFIGVRLHSVILSHCAYVPSIMLAYQAKCMDYMESVGMEKYAICTHDVKINGIGTLLDNTQINHEQIRSELFETIHELKIRLKQIAKEILKAQIG